MDLPTNGDAGRGPDGARPRRAHPCAGFTLIEALVTIAILGVVLGIGTPAYGAWIDRQRVESGVARLAATLGAARADAIRFASPVVLCPSDDGAACGGGWADGLLAFRDDDRDGAIGAGEPVLRRDGPAGGGLGVAFLAPDGTALSRVAFDYRGYPDAAGRATATRGAASASVTLSPLGRVALE